MDPVSIGITAGGFLLGGLSSMFAGDAQAELERKKKERAQELLGRSIIDTGELDTMIATSNKRFNANLQRVLNTTALRSRGLENSNVVGAAAAGEIAGQAASAESQIRAGVQLHNESVFERMATLEFSSPTPTNPFEEFVTGGISGAMAGLEISKTVGNLDKLAGLSVGDADITTPSYTAGSWTESDSTKYTSANLYKNLFRDNDLGRVSFGEDDYGSALELAALRRRFK